jgi:hypothetical protein
MRKPAKEHAISSAVALVMGLGWGFLTAESGFGAALVWLPGCVICPSVTLIAARKFPGAYVALSGLAMLAFIVVRTYRDHSQTNALDIWWRDWWIFALFAAAYIIVSSVCLWVVKRIRNEK